MLEEEIIKLTNAIQGLTAVLIADKQPSETAPELKEEPKTVTKPTTKPVAKAEPKVKAEVKANEITDKHLSELCSQLYDKAEPELCEFLDNELDKIFASFDAKTVTEIGQERREDFIKALMGLVGEKENFVPAKPSSMTVEELIAVVRDFIAPTHEDVAQRKLHMAATNAKFKLTKASLVSEDKVTEYHDHLVNAYDPEDEI